MLHQLVAMLLHSRPVQPSNGVHFHHGEQGRAYACYDGRCNRYSINPRWVD